jgi:uncharacterized membrane protein
MGPAYVLHIAAGSVALVAGFIALYAVKGAWTHRKAGRVFAYAMLTTSVAGFSIAVARDVAPVINVPAALLTTYLVITSLTALQSSAAQSRALAIGAMLVALALALTNLSFAVEAFANGGSRKGIPAFPFVLFGVVASFGTIGDLRVIRSGPLRGASRLARHLWRMSFALFIAALSFFIGQAKVFPKPIRIPALLGLPVLAVLLTMLYWLWRVRVRRSFRGLVGVRASEAV